MGNTCCSDGTMNTDGTIVPLEAMKGDVYTMRELTLAALLSLVLLGASEQLTVPLNLWVCTPAVKNVLGHVAVYVLPAEAALGPAVLVAHRMTCSRGLTTQFVAAVLVMLIYAGALAVSFLFLEAH